MARRVHPDRRAGAMRRTMKRNLWAATAVLGGTILTGCGGGAYVMVPGPPPPPRYGAMGYAPSPGFVWAEGYYDLRGGSNWVWVPGAWRRPPRDRERSGSHRPGIRKGAPGALPGRTGASVVPLVTPALLV